VQTRSGDTPQAERRRILRQPPEILITTPESLNLLLSTTSGRDILGDLDTVILDEIHSIAGSKRGTHLITAIERLTRYSGEFQRIAISATVRPLETIAAFVGGFSMRPDGSCRPRPVQIVNAALDKRCELRIQLPERIPEDKSRWPSIVCELRSVIQAHQSTLLFTNSRRLCERLTRMLNDEPLAFSHHGSLSRELRHAVEAQLKAGELPAIVSTSSLELGIDIGALDLVVLIQSPPSVASAVQRLGRSGHSVHAVTKGLLLPTHGRDFLDAAVLARAVGSHDIEPISPPRAPLDILAQVIISMCLSAEWRTDALYAELRKSWTYHTLSRQQFDLVIDMLAGKYDRIRLRELRPRLSIDRETGSIRTRKGASQALFSSGGTILDRGYYQLRDHASGAQLGELDEEFVWEQKPGVTFVMGTRAWHIERITDKDVFVTPGDASRSDASFWRAEAPNRDFHLAAQNGDFLEQAESRLDDDSFTRELRSHMDAESAEELLGFLRKQRRFTSRPLPHRQHLLIEACEGARSGDQTQVVLHTNWGARVNRPFALAISAAWEARHGVRLGTWADNHIVVALMPQDADIASILPAITPTRLESLLRSQLEQAAFFSGRFREAAGRALLLTRPGFGQRLPLWLNRLRAKKLLESVMPLSDFPILLEAWRECLQDEFDLPSLRMLLDEIADGEIAISRCTTHAPSPFTDLFGQINTFMYHDDTPSPNGGSRLRGDLIREVALSEHLRPEIEEAQIVDLEARLQRLAPGYAPTSSEDLLDWVHERLIIPEDEWAARAKACERDSGRPFAELPLCGAAHNPNSCKALGACQANPGKGCLVFANSSSMPRVCSILAKSLARGSFCRESKARCCPC
jgi:ATP-dependent helicase Lhr and Lhr-like helicase